MRPSSASSWSSSQSAPSMAKIATRVGTLRVSRRSSARLTRSSASRSASKRATSNAVTFKPLLREMVGHGAAQRIALRVELRIRREQIFDRHLLRHRRHRLGHARPDPGVPSLVDQRLRVGETIAGDAEAQPVVDRDRHAFLRFDADDSVALREPSRRSNEGVELMRRQERDVLLHDAHDAGVLVDAEDQPARRRQVEADEQIRHQHEAGEEDSSVSETVTAHCGVSSNAG